ncbi:MAG: hypothetical protein JNL96_03835 [Planctomycetaceae bacterium]|nr:hypothetical protein [Planctomycetaceae bacterium]
MSEQISLRAEEAAYAACREEHPGLEISREVKLLAVEPERFVCAVYMPLHNLKPSPYAVYVIDAKTFAARRLKATEARLYRMKNDE